VDDDSGGRADTRFFEEALPSIQVLPLQVDRRLHHLDRRVGEGQAFEELPAGMGSGTRRTDVEDVWHDSGNLLPKRVVRVGEEADDKVKAGEVVLELGIHCPGSEKTRPDTPVDRGDCIGLEGIQCDRGDRRPAEYFERRPWPAAPDRLQTGEREDEIAESTRAYHKRFANSGKRRARMSRLVRIRGGDNWTVRLSLHGKLCILREGDMTFEKLRQGIKGQVFEDEETLRELHRDFGRLVDRMPAGAIVPASTEDVSKAVRIAFEEGWKITTRGVAHSQGGQSLSPGGLLLDMSVLNRIERLGHYSAWVEAGCLWSDLVREAADRQLAPPVLTSNLDVTVGGTLSTGGLGASSFKFGTQADNVEELEVVTGEGHCVRCSPLENAELFDCARCGLGQFAIITRAKVRLRPVAPQVRTYLLVYDSVSNLMRDQELLMLEQRFDYLEAWAVPCNLGFKKIGDARVPFADWFFVLHASTEFGPEQPRDAALLDGLRFYKKVHVEDLTHLEYVFRYEPFHTHWRQTGAWTVSHPWVETVLPWQKAAPYIEGVLRGFPPTLLGGGLVTLLPRQRLSGLPLMIEPDSNHLINFGILPAVSRQFLSMALPLLKKASDLSIEMGGKRYLSGWLDFDLDQWKAHFGPSWDQVVRWKRFYDPRTILNPGFIAFSDLPS